MSASTPIRPATIARVIVSFLLAAGLVFAIWGVRQNAPTSGQDFTIPEAADVAELETTVERCGRTLPDQPALPDTDGVRDFGRVSSTAVVECPDLFDQQSVVYVGEVVGDILRRDGGAWVLVNDDDYALEVGPAGSSAELRGANSGLSVWLPGDMADELGRPGGPGWRGDVIQLSGIIHRVDELDGGGLTLRASTMHVVAPAAAADTPVNRAQLALALGLVAIVATMFSVERRVAARR
ncbi:MAG: hypothetical protein R3249_00585 [Nitriliruptorales bacterium]|nr:hypothetical protein [Nitriliruptorales bacterium]